MVKVAGFPGRYVQGPGAIAGLPKLLNELQCRQVVVVVDAFIRESVWDPIGQTLASQGVGLTIVEFPGECTEPVIARLSQDAFAAKADCVVGFGGGKTIDTAKGVALSCATRLLIIPTIASNDSPTSRLVVVYNEDHTVSGVRLLTRNPDVVLVDTEIISRAPARFFAAGLGDALSKKDEVMQCHLAGGANFFGTLSLNVVRLMAQACYDTVIEKGESALNQVRTHGKPDADVESVVEATVLLSGLAFESGGLSLAHALVRGFSAQPGLSKFLHGELVAFGSVVQVIAQKEPDERVMSHARDAARLGLPVCFADFGGYAPSDEALADIAARTCSAPYIGHLTPEISESGVVHALRTADAIGAQIRAGKQE